MSRDHKTECTKDSHTPIPTIFIENNYCSESSVQDSPPCGLPSPFFVSDGDALFERTLPFHLQASQFLCWFHELPPPKQFLFTALSLQNLSSNYINLAHCMTKSRLTEACQHESRNITKARDIEYISKLDAAADDFPVVLLDLLSSIKHRDCCITQLHDLYLTHVDKALDYSLHQKPPCDDILDSLEGQLLLVAMTTPLFTSADIRWLRNNIKSRCNGSASISASLLTLTNDLLDAFEENRGSGESLSPSSKKALPRNVRSCSMNSQFPFLPRALYPYINRRHHSLLPPMETSLNVPSPFSPSHPLGSSSSLNSSGFVSGSESMYQGLNEASGVNLRGARFPTPLNNRLYPTRRQSASPYTLQGEQLKEEDDASPLSPSPEQATSRPSRILPSSQSDVEATKATFLTSAIAVQHLLPPAPTSPLEIPICPCLPSLTVSTPQHHSLTSAPPVTSVTPVPSPAPISTAASPHSCDSTFSTQSCQVATPTEKRLTPQVLRRRRKPTLPQEYRADEPAVACVPVWLKSLRLHKYASLFHHLTYTQMLNISEDWLRLHHVTQGARNKILQSIANLAARSAALSRLESQLIAVTSHHNQQQQHQHHLSISGSGGVLRTCLVELRSLMQTPFPPAYRSGTPSADETSGVLPLPTTDTEEEDEGRIEDDDAHFGDDDEDRDFADFGPRTSTGAGASSGGALCQCPFTNSDTCLFDRAAEDLLPKRPKSSEDGDDQPLGMNSSGAGNEGGGAFFFPSLHRRNSDVPRRAPDLVDAPPSATPPLQPPLSPPFISGCNEEGPGCEESLPELFMRCLHQAFNAILSGPKDDLDNYGFFIQLLSIAFDHPSFSRTQKARLRGYQNQLVDLLGPAPPPPPRCNPHHHRAQTRRSSSHLHGMAGGRGGCGAGSSHSAPFLPRGSFCGGGCGAWGSASAGRGRFVTPLRATFNQNRSTGVLLHPPLHPNWHGGGGILRGRSAEPDVYNNIQQRRHTPPPPHHHHAQASSSRFASAFQDQAALWSASQQHPRVASMDCLAPSTPPLSPSDQQLHMTAHKIFTRSRMASYHGPSTGDISQLSAPLLQPPPTLGCCFTRSPPVSSVATSGTAGEVTVESSGPFGGVPTVFQHPDLRSPPTPLIIGDTSVSAFDFSTAEINRNLDLLTEKVTKLAMEESDSPSE